MPTRTFDAWNAVLILPLKHLFCCFTRYVYSCALPYTRRPQTLFSAGSDDCAMTVTQSIVIPLMVMMWQRAPTLCDMFIAADAALPYTTIAMLYLYRRCAWFNIPIRRTLCLWRLHWTPDGMTVYCIWRLTIPINRTFLGPLPAVSFFLGDVLPTCWCLLPRWLSMLFIIGLLHDDSYYILKAAC